MQDKRRFLVHRDNYLIYKFSLISNMKNENIVVFQIWTVVKFIFSCCRSGFHERASVDNLQYLPQCLSSVFPVLRICVITPTVQLVNVRHGMGHRILPKSDVSNNRKLKITLTTNNFSFNLIVVFFENTLSWLNRTATRKTKNLHLVVSERKIDIFPSCLLVKSNFVVFFLVVLS